MPKVNVTITESRKVSGVAEVSIEDINRLFMETQTAHTLVNHARLKWLAEVFPAMARRDDLDTMTIDSHGCWVYVYDYHPHNDSELFKKLRTATESEIQAWSHFDVIQNLITETTK